MSAVMESNKGPAPQGASRNLGGLNNTDRTHIRLRYHTGVQISQSHMTALRDLINGDAVVAGADGNAVPEHPVVICPRHDKKTLVAGMILTGFHDQTNGTWYIAGPQGREQLVKTSSVMHASQPCPGSANNHGCGTCQNRMMS